MHKILTIAIVLMIVACVKPDTLLESANLIIEESIQSKIVDTRLVAVDLKTEIDKNKITVKGYSSDKELIEIIRQKMDEKFPSSWTDAMELLPASDLGDQLFAVVKLSVTPLRGKPKHSAEQVDQAIMGSIHSVLKYDDNGWYLIQTSYDYIAWISESAITRLNASELENWKHSNLHRYMGSIGKIYETANENANQVYDIVVHGIVNVKALNKNWAQVELVSKKTGYIPMNLLEKYSYDSSLNTEIDALIGFSKSFLGVPYLWGGNSPKGYDCSGFTQTVFKVHGKQLPRDADQQSFQGSSIDATDDFSNVKAGDLLFFGPNKDRITHVGISLGAYDYIHCSGEVRYNSFNKTDSLLYNDYLFNNLQKIRRVL